MQKNNELSHSPCACKINAWNTSVAFWKLFATWNRVPRMLRHILKSPLSRSLPLHLKTDVCAVFCISFSCHCSACARLRGTSNPTSHRLPQNSRSRRKSNDCATNSVSHILFHHNIKSTYSNELSNNNNENRLVKQFVSFFLCSAKWRCRSEQYGCTRLRRCDIAAQQRNKSFTIYQRSPNHISFVFGTFIDVCLVRLHAFIWLRVPWSALLHNLSVSFVIAVGFFCCFCSVSSHPRLRSYAYGHMAQPKPIFTTPPPEIDNAHQPTRKWTSRRYAAVCLPRLNCLSIFPSYILL